MVLTRRMLLERVAAVGGAGAAYMAMEAMGLAMPTPPGADRFKLPDGSGNGRSVVVLGAGIAGLVAAYELRRAGYDVAVLEARGRVGGRAWTIRGGEAIEHMGRETQRASLSPGQYFNAGAARIPSTHRAILGYAKRLGVAMEPFVNRNENARWEFGGKVIPARRLIHNLEGRIGELLAKAIDRRALDGAASKDEIAHLREFLAFWAGLDEKGVLQPAFSAGYAEPAGGYQHPGTLNPPLTLAEILPSREIATPLGFEQILHMQSPLLQPVGGMDRIAYAFYDQVKPSVRLGQQVTAIRRDGAAVRIEHGGTATRADYCVCTLPANLLERIPSDFSAPKKAALKGAPYLASAKIAFEGPRFWEDDGIYGGLAWTDRLNENVLYPSNGFGSARGVLIGAYCGGWNHGNTPDAFVTLPFAEQVRISLASVEALHPGKSALLGEPVIVNWGRVPFSEGAAAVGPDFDDSAPGVARGPRYQELLKPEGPIVFAGEHLSYVGFWQEGAVLSAHEALNLLSAMVRERAV